METISREALKRLPAYLRLLIELKERGEINVSSSQVALALQLNSVQVRKDLASVASQAGRPKTGFAVSDLIVDISNFLGYNNTSQAILVGVGSIGKALLGYGNFNSYGLEIVAAFDSRDIGADIVYGKPVFNITKLCDLVARLKIDIGIITVPSGSAQEVCDIMVASGIRAIWNFAPVHLNIPPNVVIKNEDMAASLAVLSKELDQLLKRDNIEKGV